MTEVLDLGGKTLDELIDFIIDGEAKCAQLELVNEKLVAEIADRDAWIESLEDELGY
jgi:hypothetical protein